MHLSQEKNAFDNRFSSPIRMSDSMTDSTQTICWMDGQGANHSTIHIRNLKTTKLPFGNYVISKRNRLVFVEDILRTFLRCSCGTTSAARVQDISRFLQSLSLALCPQTNARLNDVCQSEFVLGKETITRLLVSQSVKDTQPDPGATELTDVD